MAILQDIDYEKLEKDLRDGLNSIATAQWSMIQGASVGMIDSVAASLSKTSMQQQYDALRTQFDDLKDGKLQSANETLIRQLQNGEDQLVLAGEATFIDLSAMETQGTSLQRQLAALNRTVEELELRYRLGQISALQLQEAKAGRTALVSGLETLRMNIRTYKEISAYLEGRSLDSAEKAEEAAKAPYQQALLAIGSGALAFTVMALLTHFFG